MKFTQNFRDAIRKLQTRSDSNYLGIADIIYTNHIETQLQAKRQFGIHYSDGVEKTLDYILEHKEEHEKKAPEKEQAVSGFKFKTGYFVQQKRGTDIPLQRSMKRVALTHTTYFVKFDENGKMTEVRRVR